MATSIAENDLTKFRKLVDQYNANITLYFIDPQYFNGLPTKTHLPIPTYFRFLLPTLVSARKILYLDADILCLRSIQPLIDLDLNGKILAAVSDKNEFAVKRITALHLSQYFNAGVLYLDREEWDSEGISDRAISMLLESPEKFYALDQDALNIIADGRTKFLEKRWNYILNHHLPTDIITAQNEAVFLHIAGHIKPWSTVSRDNHLQEIYYRYEQQSPWAGLPPQEPTNHSDMRCYSRLLWQENHYYSSITWYARYMRAKLQYK
jgi:lipopolysaccharide biosynthesis glycosyltransferase